MLNRFQVDSPAVGVAESAGYYSSKFVNTRTMKNSGSVFQEKNMAGRTYKILIITHPQLAAGYRLAGVEVEEVQSSKEALELIEHSVRSGKEYGIIGIDEDLYNDFDDKITKKIDEWGIPLVVPFPSSDLYRWVRAKREEDYATSLIRSAIGYQIKLKR